MKTKSAWLCFMAACLVSPGTFAQNRLPTDAEVRSAYCISSLQREIAAASEVRKSMDAQLLSLGAGNAATEKRVAALRQSLNSLNRLIADRERGLGRHEDYLIPKMGGLEIAPLLAASIQAEADAQHLKAATTQCSVPCMRRGGEASNCANECVGVELLGKMESCRNPTWIPS